MRTLYLKRHTKTGKMYLGKTEQVDPHSYCGSGKVWISHLKKHGYDYETYVLYECEDSFEFKAVAIYFSELLNVVNDKDFANLVIEQGDGGDTSTSYNFKKAMRVLAIKKKRNKWWNNGIQQVHAEIPPDESFVLGRLSFVNSGAQIGANVIKTMTWANDGINESMFRDIPIGWSKGRLKSKKCTRKNSAKGATWWNDGKISKMSPNSPGPTFSKGRLKSQKILT